MQRMLITPKDLEAFMSKEQYHAFLKNVIERAKESSDHEYTEGPIWLIAEWK